MAEDSPARVGEVLEAERAHLRPDGSDRPYSAVCLSGGGIRSASFALGLIQGLAQKGILTSFDYLSTVSGGGYTGGWLAGWLYHAGRESVARQLRVDDRADSVVEPEPVAHIRANSRFMSPATGVLSADTWTLVATVARNLFLNWLVLLPIVAAALLVPHFYLALLQKWHQPFVVGGSDAPTDPASLLFFASSVLVVVANAAVIMNLPSYGNRRGGQRTFLTWGLVPQCASVIGVTLLMSATRQVGIGFAAFAGFGAALLGISWTAFGWVSPARRWRPYTVGAAVVAGWLAAGGLWSVAHLMKGWMNQPGYATLGFPLVLGIIVVSAFVFMGLAGPDIGDDDLEWWSRDIAWLFIVAVSWLAVTTIVFEAPEALIAVRDAIGRMAGLPQQQATALIGAVTSALGAVAARVGRSMDNDRSTSLGRRLAFALAAPGFCVFLLALLAWTNLTLLSMLDGGVTTLANLSIVGAVYLATGLIMGRFVPVNKFSLHGMYRNRLIRTFLGASRSDRVRRPNPFTGFDPDDDVELFRLAAIGHPLLVVNMTLNKVAEASGGWLHRKGEPFTATPLYVGSRSVGYRPCEGYGANPRLGRRGLSLGTAMTISGAAASPNMGAYSSPALTLLLTLFNARLGTWLGNPGPAGKRTWRTDEPTQHTALIILEMLGRTSDQSPYVYLSDGGHFDNLGLWEMIQRRCRYVLVSDAACDPAYRFDDLATAIRQIRIDLGVPIVFEQGCTMDRDHQALGNPHHAVGRILYSAIDGAAAEDGILVYVKATLCGREPIDVLTYGKGHPAFPHESTANQWYGESQFESYRMLGFHTIHHMTAGYSGPEDVASLFTWLARQGAGSAVPVAAAP